MTTIRLVCLLFISHTFADISFKRFCNRPSNFGKGKYVEKDQKCTVTYNVVSKSETAAAEFCSLQHPYTPGQVSYTKYTTTCDIYGFHECSDEEQLIGETCFLYDLDTPYNVTSNICKKISRDYKYELHIVKSQFEQKWISTFFSDLGLMWVGNSDSDMDYLDVIRFNGKALTGMHGRLVSHVSSSVKTYVIITRKGSAARIRAGYLVPMLPEAYVPVLCSRPATPKDEYLSGLMNKYAEAGIHAANFPDRSNKLRAFSILRGLHAFEIEKDVFDAGTARLHKACSAFKHGYAATPFDFQNVDDFKKLLKDAKVNIVAVPGRRTTKIENYESCTEKDPEFESARRTFQFDLVAPDGSIYHRAAVNDSFWRKTFPDRTCGDMPRTALAFTQEGLIDIPNIARLFVACTFGIAPKMEGRPDEMCSLAGKLVKGECQCNDPKMDVKIQKEMRRYPGDEQSAVGTKCVDCMGNRQYAVLFIVDQNSDAGRKNVRFVTEYLKWPLAYYQFSVRLYSWYRDSFDAIGSGFEPVPFSKAMKDYWFSSKTADIVRIRDSSGLGGRTKLTNAIQSAAKDIALQPFKRKFIIIITSGPAEEKDMESAKEAAKELKKDIDIMVYSQSKAEKFDEFCTYGKAMAFDWNKWVPTAEAATDMIHRMLRKICLK